MHKLIVKSGLEHWSVFTADKKVVFNMYFNNLHYIEEALFLLTYKFW